jgi:hypothetical protein
MSKVRFIIAIADDNNAPLMVLERFHTFDQMARDLPFVLKNHKKFKKDIRCYQRTTDDNGVITTWEVKVK